MPDSSVPTTHVFVGPSLPRDEVRRIVPSATLHSPVRHGDLARIDARPGDTVLIIDGLFLHSAAVRHKEILALLTDGVAVAGSSSMGALRAAELSPFGMHGVGQIFELYRDGVIDGDDEVAIVHSDHETGHRPLSEPMVNIRFDLIRARDARILDAEAHDLLLSGVRSQPFRRRSLAELTRLAHGLLPEPVARAFAAWLPRHHIDTKAADARALLKLVAEGNAGSPPSGAIPPAQITNHDTIYSVGWTLGFGGRMVDQTRVSHADTIALVAVCDPDFPHRFRRAVLARLAGENTAAPDDPIPRSADVDERVRAIARSRGLLRPDGELADSCRAWLTATERDLPGDEAILRVLVRAYGCRPAAQTGILATLMPADATDWYRRAAAVSGFADLALGRRSPDGNGAARRLTAAAVDRFCADLWGCSEADLTAAAADRGFPSLEHARRAAGDLAVHARWFGTEQPPSHRTDRQPVSTVGSQP